eukprot:SAG31_NODE_368_length_16798_cov_20.422780_2_plen_330_part_00
MADHLGITAAERPSLLWVAQRCLAAPLPRVWQSHTSADGEVYYHCDITNQSTWSHPLDRTFKAILAAARQDNTAPARRWETLFDEFGHPYFHCAESGATTWEVPEEMLSLLPPPSSQRTSVIPESSQDVSAANADSKPTCSSEGLHLMVGSVEQISEKEQVLHSVKYVQAEQAKQAEQTQSRAAANTASIGNDTPTQPTSQVDEHQQEGVSASDYVVLVPDGGKEQPWARILECERSKQAREEERERKAKEPEVQHMSRAPASAVVVAPPTTPNYGKYGDDFEGRIPANELAGCWCGFIGPWPYIISISADSADTINIWALWCAGVNPC